MTELMTGATQVPFATLVERATELAWTGERSLLGITGAPGAGKTTLANALVEALGDAAVLVAMDGFHLANELLIERNARDHKGAPDTFDVGGYIALLKRLRTQTDDVIYAPQFDRAADASIGSAVPVRKSTPLVIAEGNYLLLENGGWGQVRPLLDQAWFIATADGLRQQRLILRHMDFGLTGGQARDWALGTDEHNAQLVSATRSAADLVACVNDVPFDKVVEWNTL